jgi:acetyl-CoA carboxylase carboxyltransferase component
MAKDEDPKSDPSNSNSESDKAISRLTQVEKHLTPDANTSKRRRRKQSDTPQLPADYSDILGQLNALKKMAATPDLANRGYVRQKQAGKLWVRERVEAFVDPGTFREVGSVSGTVGWKMLGGVKEEPVECMWTPYGQVSYENGER